MNSLTGERILYGSEGQGLLLTTHRIRYEAPGTGFAQIKSIMLEEVASCAWLRTTQPIWLVLAGLLFIAGVIGAASSREPALAVSSGTAAALICVALYFGTRRGTLALASAGATIRVDTKAMKLEVVRQVIDTLEWAKNHWYLHGEKSQHRQYAT